MSTAIDARHDLEGVGRITFEVAAKFVVRARISRHRVKEIPGELMSKRGSVGVAAFIKRNRVSAFFTEVILGKSRILRSFFKLVPFVEPLFGFGRTVFSRRFALLAFAFISAFVLLFVVDE